jgi:hypothetical protein
MTNQPEDTSYRVVEHVGGKNAVAVEASGRVMEGLNQADAELALADLRKAGRKASLWHGSNCIDPDPSLGVATRDRMLDDLKAGKEF